MQSKSSKLALSIYITSSPYLVERPNTRHHPSQGLTLVKSFVRGLVLIYAFRSLILSATKGLLLVDDIDNIYALSTDEIRMRLAPRLHLHCKRCLLLCDLWYRHRVYLLPWNMLEIKAVQETGNRNPYIHLSNFPARTDSTAWMSRLDDLRSK